MRVGIVGTGAIATKHAAAYRNLGWEVAVCTNQTEERGRQFAVAHHAEFVTTVEELCRHPRVDYVDLCTFPSFRLPVVELCARYKKHVLVQKPMAIDLETADRMITVADNAGIQLGVVSQHRFDDSTLFLKQAIMDGRLGRIVQADAYVKWFRSAEYYSRPVKGSWAVEGGGALINQAIHQVDLLLHLIGPVTRLYGEWQLGGTHAIESEDSVSVVMRYANGATGVVQASTAIVPGYPERLEIHGTKGSAIVSGDKLTAWDVSDDDGPAPPLESHSASGASDPMAISTQPFERQFVAFAQACADGAPPSCNGHDGRRALQFVLKAYESCREGRAMVLEHDPASRAAC